jgi:hypothetical protein
VATHLCLLRQDECLYPLPHCSHFRSPPLPFLPSFMRCWPSLARLMRDFLKSVSSSSSISSSFWSSSIALSPRSDLPLDVNLIRWLGKLAGGEGKLPTADLAFDIVFLRLEIGIPNEFSPDSLTAATMAATLLAAFDETLLRRVTL